MKKSLLLLLMAIYLRKISVYNDRAGSWNATAAMLSVAFFKRTSRGSQCGPGWYTALILVF